MRRVAELDGLRGIAACVIVLFHLWFFQGRFGTIILLGTAVDMFFVLSGYLITDIIRRGMDAKGFLLNFYARRGLRIWPIYYFTILGYLLSNALLRKPESIEGLSYLLTYTQTLPPLFPLWDPPPLLHRFSYTWTLSIEELYYLVWPGLLLLIGSRRIPIACVLLFLASVAFRFAGVDDRTLPARCDGFALGGLLAWLFADREWVTLKRTTLQAAFVGLGLVGLSYPYWGRMLFRGSPYFPPERIYAITIAVVNLIYFATLGLVLLNVGRPITALLRDRRLAYLGVVSYGLYLYHPFAFHIADWLADQIGLGRPLWLDLLKLAATLGVSAFSWRYIEQPILSLKKRFDYHSPSRQPAAPILRESVEGESIPIQTAG